MIFDWQGLCSGVTIKRGKEIEEVNGVKTDQTASGKMEAVFITQFFTRCNVVAAYLVTCCWCVDQCIPHGF